MDKSEKKLILNKVRDLIKHSEILLSNITEFDSLNTDMISKAKDLYSKGKKDKAIEIIPLMRESAYNYSLYALDVESVNSSILTLIELVSELKIEVDFTKDEEEFLDNLSCRSWKHTEVKGNKLEILPKSDYTKIMEEVGFLQTETDEALLEKVINS